MAPTPFVLLLVAALWTIPVSAIGFWYQRQSDADVNRLRRSINQALSEGSIRALTQSDR